MFIKRHLHDICLTKSKWGVEAEIQFVVRGVLG